MPTLHLSVPELIADRTNFLLQSRRAETETEPKLDGQEQEKGSEDSASSVLANPGVSVGQLIRAAKLSAEFLSPGGIFECIVPCNTFHAPIIFDATIKSSGGITPVHMVMETVKHIRLTYPNIKNIGLMCTTATRSLRLYHDMLSTHGYIVCEVPEEDQSELQRTIYDPSQGIKAKSKTNWSTTRFESYAQKCVDLGAEVVILGCTEIPIVLETFSVPLIDPMVCGARALIRRTYPEKLL